MKTDKLRLSTEWASENGLMDELLKMAKESRKPLADMSKEELVTFDVECLCDLTIAAMHRGRG
tara:strand:+ start:169 stop:357 length:189 start_codon:yes stop_codon:yes gene_type:complete